jgi:hypothetical protein
VKRYVFGLIIAAASSAAALGVVVLFLNPFTSGWIGLTLLLVSLYFLVASIFTLIGFVVRVLRSRKEIIYAHLATAFRQGLLLSLIIVGSLLLQSFRIFNIWSALLFVAAVVLVELAFQSHASSVELRSSRKLSNQAPLSQRARGALPGQRLNGTGKADQIEAARAMSDVTPKQHPEPWQTRFNQRTEKE